MAAYVDGRVTLTTAARYYAASGEEHYRTRFLAELEVASRDDAFKRLRRLLGDDADEMARAHLALDAIMQRVLALGGTL